MLENIDSSLVDEVLSHEVPEFTLPISIYDIELGSADGTSKDVLGKQKGKVTLLFNVAAGCGNIPQHSVLEELNQLYRNEEDFSIIAVTVDDFTCHGYPEFNDGIQKYIDSNQLNITVGEFAKKYAEEHFGTTYDFSELTNGRHDKHTYDPTFAPGSVKQQEQHTLWSYLTWAYNADMQENGIPYHNETVSWSNAVNPAVDGKRLFSPLLGNFTKFLIDRTGTKARRYANGFLLGERTLGGETFPWYQEKLLPDGRHDYRPETVVNPRRGPAGTGEFPSPLQRFGIDVSLKLISRDIDRYLLETI